MDENEMIKDKEQMARIIAFDLCGQSYHSNWWGNEAQCYSENNFHDCKKIKAVVDKLYNAGYRKVGEDEIVESMKTYERAREETAREILQELYYEATSNVSEIVELTTFQIEQLANRYGIELEENL